MLAFIKKWWQVIVIGVMSVLLVIAISMIIILKRDVTTLNKLVEERDKLLRDEYNKNEIIYEKNKALVDSMEVLVNKQKVIVITKNNNYETIKGSPTNYNITDAQLLKLLKEFESKHKIR